MRIDDNHIIKGKFLDIDDISLYQCFLRSVELYPQKVAILSGERKVTYYELSRLVQQIADAIEIVFQGDKINFGFCMERSINQIAAMLAIIKTGHVCVPISSSFPIDRILNICSQIECKAIIHDNSLNANKSHFVIPMYHINVFIDVDSTKYKSIRGIERYIANPFVFFTSGSTGKPKGVWISQKSIINCLIWRKHLCDVDSNDVFFYKAPLTFDISLWEIFLPLINGASLVVANPMSHYLMSYISRTIEKNKVTVIQFVGSVLRRFLNEVDPLRCSSLRAIFCGGETWNWELGKKVCQLYPSIDIYNVYGQTETSLGSSGWKFDLDYPYQCLTIGKPNYNTQYLIMSENLESVDGINEYGELYIGGIGVSDGYVSNPSETRKRFITIETESLSLGRFYKTGDFVRKFPDGNFVFLGRKDNQVKIFGTRIELEEIENLVNDISEVNASAAIRVVKNEDIFIVLFVQLNKKIKSTKILNSCKKNLPGIMLPKEIVVVDKIPITINGKIDRKYLSKNYKSSL